MGHTSHTAAPILYFFGLIAVSMTTTVCHAGDVPAGWSRHTDRMGFSIDHPAGWQVGAEPGRGGFQVAGPDRRGNQPGVDSVTIRPMFLEKRKLDARGAAALLSQLARDLHAHPDMVNAVNASQSWTAPRMAGRFVVTSCAGASLKEVAMLTWANSPKGATLIFYHLLAPE